MKFGLSTIAFIALNLSVFACKKTPKKADAQNPNGAQPPLTAEQQVAAQKKLEDIREKLENGPWNTGINTDFVTFSSSAYEFSETTVKLTTWCTSFNDGQNLVVQVEAPYTLTTTTLSFEKSISSSKSGNNRTCEAKIEAGVWQFSQDGDKLILKNTQTSFELSKI